MLKYLLVAITLGFANAAMAFCSGPNQFDRLPESEKAALIEKTTKAPWSSGLLWKVEKNDIESFVIGTIHFPDAGLEPIEARVKDLMPSVKRVFLEMTKQDEAALQNHLRENPELVFISEGPTLIDRLSEEAWAEISSKLEERGMPPFMAAKMQPWILGLTISIPVCAMEALKNGEKGLDRRLEAQAIQAGLPIQSLDNARDLISVLAEGTIEEQVEDFEIGIAMGLNSEEDRTMLDLYLREETLLIWEYGVAKAQSTSTRHDLSELLDEFEQKLVTDRNHAWIEQLAPVLEEYPSMIAVGALHLSGHDGILQLLKDQGFSITRLPL